MDSRTRIARILDRATTSTEVEADVQLQRIVHALQRMRHAGYAPIAYHGKMREEDVRVLEAVRHEELSQRRVTHAQLIDISEARRV